MNIRKLKFDGKDIYSLQKQEQELLGILSQLPQKTGFTYIIFEETLHFGGEWEATLYLFNKKTNEFLHYEECTVKRHKLLKEYNSDISYKSYLFFECDKNEFLPIYCFFYIDEKNNILNHCLVYDIELKPSQISDMENIIYFNQMVSTKDLNIEHCHININKYNATPFLFLKNN